MEKDKNQVMMRNGWIFAMVATLGPVVGYLVNIIIDPQGSGMLGVLVALSWFMFWAVATFRGFIGDD